MTETTEQPTKTTGTVDALLNQVAQGTEFHFQSGLCGDWTLMAEEPGLLKAYQDVHGLFADSSFNEDELTVVWQTINVYHSCHYCVPAHTAIAKQMGADDSITRQLNSGETLDDSKLQALRSFTEAMHLITYCSLRPGQCWRPA